MRGLEQARAPGVTVLEANNDGDGKGQEQVERFGNVLEKGICHMSACK